MAPLTGVKGDGTKLRVSSFNPVLRHLFGAGPGTAFDDDCSLLVEMFLRSLRTKDFPPIRQTKLHIHTHHQYDVTITRLHYAALLAFISQSKH